MKPSDMAWNRFMETGRIDAYLQYKAQRDAALEMDASSIQAAMENRMFNEAENRRHRPPGLQNRR